MSSPCPPVVFFLEAGHAVRSRRRALSGSPPLLLLSQSVRPCASTCMVIGRGCQRISGRSCPFCLFWSCSPLGVLHSCCPGVLLPVARSWCPFGVARSELVLFCPLGVFVVLLMSSSGFYVVLLPSCCLRWLSKAGAEFMAGNWLIASHDRFTAVDNEEL